MFRFSFYFLDYFISFFLSWVQIAKVLYSNRRRELPLFRHREVRRKKNRKAPIKRNTVNVRILHRLNRRTIMNGRVTRRHPEKFTNDEVLKKKQNLRQQMKIGVFLRNQRAQKRKQTVENTIHLNRRQNEIIVRQEVDRNRDQDLKLHDRLNGMSKKGKHFEFEFDRFLTNESKENHKEYLVQSIREFEFLIDGSNPGHCNDMMNIEIGTYEIQKNFSE